VRISCPRFLNDETLKGPRETFFDGSGPAMTTPAKNKRLLSPEKHSLARIEPRLRRLVVRAGHNSCAATNVMQRFEDYILQHYFPEPGYEKVHLADWWTGLLEDEPTTKMNVVEEPEAGCEASSSSSSPQGSNTLLQLEFVFPDTPNAGFHRLLLHAVCQFHGLKAMAKNATSQDSSQDIRMSNVSGRIEETPEDAKLPISLIACI
jgi:hypothetical protein